MYKRQIVGWEVDDTLDSRMVINALKKAFKTAKPKILNSEQGCQFTSQQYIDFVKKTASVKAWMEKVAGLTIS